MHPIRKAGTDAAAFLRARIKRSAGDGAGSAPVRGAQREQRIKRMTQMYEALRRAYHSDLPSVKDGLPELHDIEAVEERAVNGNWVYASFFSTLGKDGDLNRAIITFHRRMINAAKEPGRARAMAQVFQNVDQLRPIADICLAVSALREPVPSASWELFTRNDLGLVVRFAPIEYFRCGFDLDPQTAAAALDRVANGDVSMTADAQTWLEVANLAFAAGYERQSAYVLDRAEDELSAIENLERRMQTRDRIDTMRQWHGRAANRDQPLEIPAGQVAFALTDYHHPDLNASSDNASDAVETLTVLGHLARHEAVQFDGDPGLVAVAKRLQAAARPGARVPGAAATVQLVTVDRDLDNLAALPDDTWTVISDWFVHPLSDRRFETPFHPRLRPIFLSFHIEEPALARAGVVEYLREHGPIGCLDWATVQLLQAADVPAFYSGAIATTTADVLEDSPRGRGGESAWFDLDPQGRGRRRSLHWHKNRSRTLAQNLQETLDTLGAWRSEIGTAVTTDLRFALAARSLSMDVDFRPNRPETSENFDLRALSDADFARMRAGVSDKLAKVFTSILAGAGVDEVYKVWREACAADVAAAEAVRDNVGELGSVDFDLDGLCDKIRAASVTVERSEPAGAGTELNIEFSLDANYKPKLDVVLDSVVAHTDRPVRAFILCRQHGPEDFARMARLFPTVSFVWMPTDDVDYGPIAGKVPWASLATMDRTLLPLIQPDVDRIMHLDLDLLCVGDIAELFDTPNEGRPLVAILEPQMCFRSGYDTIRRTAGRLRAVGTPELATELMSRVVQLHPFDFDVFNAGVMVMNLDRMRADDFCARFLPYVQRYGVNGQEVLNIYVGNDYVRVDKRWNLNIRLEVPQGARIVHWAGPFKPWRRSWYVTGRELWDHAQQRFDRRVDTHTTDTVIATG